MKKKVLLIVTVIVMSTILYGCIYSEKNREETIADIEEANGILVSIETEYSDNEFSDIHLVYHKDTRVVYMVYGINSSINGITPYISENGNYMKCENGQLVEITKVE